MHDPTHPKSGKSNGALGSLQCPCCGSRLALGEGNGTAQLIAEDTSGPMPTAAGNIFIDPHAHMISRTTNDYIAMANAGVAAVIEPAFWIGQPHQSRILGRLSPPSSASRNSRRPIRH